MNASWLYVFAVPVVAVVTCVLCRGHGVLLCLGGLLTVPTGWFMVNLIITGEAGRDTHNDFAYAVIVLPPLAAGIILLVGGLVRWGVARRERDA